jgi:hypothetical protein
MAAVTEIPGMLATLCCWENWLGPYHPNTLRLSVELGIALWQGGDPARARPLLERAVRDLGRCLGRDHKLRLQALAALYDVLTEQLEYTAAEAVRHELLSCGQVCGKVTATN